MQQEEEKKLQSKKRCESRTKERRRAKTRRRPRNYLVRRKSDCPGLPFYKESPYSPKESSFLVYQAASPTTARTPATANDERERVDEAEEVPAAVLAAAAAEEEAPEALAEAEAATDPVAEAAEDLWGGEGGGREVSLRSSRRDDEKREEREGKKTHPAAAEDSPAAVDWAKAGRVEESTAEVATTVTVEVPCSTVWRKGRRRRGQRTRLIKSKHVEVGATERTK